MALQGAVVTGEAYMANILLPAICPPAGCALPIQPNAIITFKWHPRVQMNEHSHQFRNLPLTLTESHDDVRKVGANNNKEERTPSTSPRDNDHEQDLDGTGETI